MNCSSKTKDGIFMGADLYGDWWSSKESGSATAYVRHLSNLNVPLYRYDG